MKFSGSLPGISIWITFTLLSNGLALAQPNVVAWGSNSAGQTNVPLDLTNAIAVAAGVSHSVALRADGTVVAWGNNSNGQTNVPPDLTNVVAVACGAYHSLALKSGGTVNEWGANGSTPPSDLSNVVAIAAGSSVSYALRSDGSVTMWGSGTPTPIGLGNVLSFCVPLLSSRNWAAICDDGAFVQGPSGSIPAPTNFIYALSSTGPALTTEGTVSICVGTSYQWADSGLADIVAIAPGTFGSFTYIRRENATRDAFLFGIHG